MDISFLEIPHFTTEHEIESKSAEIPPSEENIQPAEQSISEIKPKKKLKKEKSVGDDQETPAVVPENATIEEVISHIADKTSEQKISESKSQEELLPERITQEEAEEPLESSHAEEELPQQSTPETRDVEMIPKKIKKKIQKKKLSEEDENIKRLLEQEIPKTELERYEKFAMDQPKKIKKPEYAELQPIPIERKEQKPTKIKIISADELPQPIRLKPKKPKQQEKREVEEKLPKFKLKSRITMIEAPIPMFSKITDLKTIRGQGELSRNMEEAEKIIKSKIKKFKHIKKRKDSMERPELEVYERYQSSSDESETQETYRRPSKVKQPEEEIETKPLKIGKGSKILGEVEPEQVKLRKVPEKPTPGESKTEQSTTKKVDRKESESNDDLDQKHKLKPLERFEFEPYDGSRETPEKFDGEKEPKEPEVPEKMKPLKKKKDKPEPEIIQHPIFPGM